jgi:hypothetical protein
MACEDREGRTSSSELVPRLGSRLYIRRSYSRQMYSGSKQDLGSYSIPNVQGRQD